MNFSDRFHQLQIEFLDSSYYEENFLIPSDIILNPYTAVQFVLLSILPTGQTQ